MALRRLLIIKLSLEVQALSRLGELLLLLLMSVVHAHVAVQEKVAW